MANSIDLDFADGSYTFALPLERIDELQRKTGAGIGKLFGRVLKGFGRSGEDITLNPSVAEFFALDVIETVRQGLIGGGKGVVDGAEIKVTPILAQRLMANYVLSAPLSYAWELAGSILAAVILGYDPPGEVAPGKSPAATSETTKVP